MVILHYFKLKFILAKTSNVNIITFYVKQNMFKLILKTLDFKNKRKIIVLFSIPNLLSSIHHFHSKHVWNVGQSWCPLVKENILNWVPISPQESVKQMTAVKQKLSAAQEAKPSYFLTETSAPAQPKSGAGKPKLLFPTKSVLHWYQGHILVSEKWILLDVQC